MPPTNPSRPPRPPAPVVATQTEWPDDTMTDDQTGQQDDADEQDGDSEPDEDYVKSKAEIEAIIEKRLAERDAAHEKQLAKARATSPVLQVSAHGGGPGVDNHRPSWSKAEQEASQAGENLDQWHDDE